MSDLGRVVLDAIVKVDWAILLLAAIPLAIIANLLTPIVARWMSRHSQAQARRRLEDLRGMLSTVKEMTGHPITFSTEVFTALFRVLLLIAAGSFLVAFPLIDIVTGPIAAIFFLMALSLAQREIRLLRRCRDLREFEAEVLAEIEQLQRITSGKGDPAA